jgi:hypothetical protein
LIYPINVKLTINIIITFYIVIICSPVYSQASTDNNLYKLDGKIINKETCRSLSLVHIFNERTRKTTISDTSGNFTIDVGMGDTLVFSSIGYFYKVVYITGSMVNKRLAIVEMKPRKYEVPEAKIVVLGTYEQFRQKLLSLKLPKTRTDILRESLQKVSKEVAMEVEYNRKMDRMTQGGNLLCVKILTPEEIQMIQLRKIREKEKIQKAIEEKYNRKIISEVTGLEDKELTEFMVFCNFSDEFLLESTQYDILIKVLEKLKEFKKLKNSGLNCGIDIQMLS